MTELTPERLQELRRIAEEATPGPWDTTRYNGGLRFDGPLRVYAGTDPEYGEPRPIPATDADTRYIAAFDPPTVLALLDEIERLRADAARYRWLRKGESDDIAVVRGLGAMDYGMSAVIGTYSEEIYGDDLDAAIDAALEVSNG